MRDFVQVPPGFRQMLEELADLAVLLLDELDGDVDLEDNGDHEPWLAGASTPLAAVDAEEDLSEREPSLGSFDRMLNQEHSYQVRPGTWSPNQDLELVRSDFKNGELTKPRGEVGRHLGDGLRFVPADADAIKDARTRLGAIMDRVRGKR